MSETAAPEATVASMPEPAVAKTRTTKAKEREAAEATTKGVLERGKGPATTEAQKLANKAIEEMNRGDAHSALEMIDRRKTQADKGKAAKTIDEKIGAQEIDPATGKKPERTDAGEKQRFEDANKAAEQVAKFLDRGKGWRGLTEDEKNEIRPNIKERLKTIGGEYLQGKTDAEINTLVDEWMNDPKVFDKVKSLYEGRLVNPGGRIGEDSEGQKSRLEDANRAYEEIAQQHAQTLHDLKTETESYEKDWVEKDDPANPGGPKINGEKQRELDELVRQKNEFDRANPDFVADKEAEEQRLKERVKSYADREKNLLSGGARNQNIGALQNSIEQAGKDYKEAIADLEKVQKELSEYKTRETKIDNLNREKAGKETRIENLRAKDIELQEQATEKIKDLEKANLENNESVLGRESQEKEFVKSVEDIFADAMEEAIEDQLRAALTDGLSKMLQEEADGTSDPHRRALLSALEHRYEKADQSHGLLHTGLKRSENRTVPDENKVQQDLDLLKNSDPKDARRIILERALLQAKNPDTKERYTMDQVKELMANDPEFIKNNYEDAVAALLTKGIESKQVSAKDLNNFVEKGYVSKDKMIQLVSSSSTVKENAKKAGVTGETFEFFKKHKKLGWWLALTAAFPAVGLVVGGGYAGYKFLKPDGGGAHA